MMSRKSHNHRTCPNNDKKENKQNITKTYLFNFDPLKPLLYSKTGITLFFLFLLENTDYGYSLESPRQGGSNEFLQPMFWAEV